MSTSPVLSNIMVLNKSLNFRRILALIVLIAMAIASLVLVDRRIMIIQQSYADTQPRSTSN